MVEKLKEYVHFLNEEGVYYNVFGRSYRYYFEVEVKSNRKYFRGYVLYENIPVEMICIVIDDMQNIIPQDIDTTIGSHKKFCDQFVRAIGNIKKELPQNSSVQDKIHLSFCKN